MTRTIRGYRIRWQQDGTDQQVTAVVDHGTRRIALTTPDAEPVEMDVVTARAVSMILSDAVYRALTPDGPRLALDTDTGSGFTTLQESS